MFPIAFYPTNAPHPPRAAFYSRAHKTWTKDGKKARRVKNPAYALIWPKDGKHETKWGRFKDIMSNQGPDMYVSISANESEIMNDRPRRHQWIGFADTDDDFIINPSLKARSWTKNGALGGRTPGLSYDFRTRQYGRPNRYSWIDAVYKPEKSRSKLDPYPEAIRNHQGRWFQKHAYPPCAIEGSFHNQQGMGMAGFSGLAYATASADAGFW